MDKPWVLVSDGDTGQARSTVAAVRGLGLAGYRPAVTVSGPWSLAAASRHCARRIRVPRVESPGYAQAVRRELDSGAYVTLIASSDAALLALGMPVEHLVDKRLLLDRAREVGLSVPPSRSFGSSEELLAAADHIDYPVVVKGHISRQAAYRADSPDQLGGGLVQDGPLLVQPYLSERLRAVAGVVWEGRLAAVVHQRYLRIWPPQCGTACAAETTEPDLEIEGRLLDLLADYQGIFQAQLAGPYLLDLNPRVYGSLPLSIAAGANLPAIYCDLLRGRTGEMVRATPGVFYRWLEGDIRHLARAVRDRRLPLGNALRQLRPRRGAAHSTESLSDPGPMAARLAFAATKPFRSTP